MQGNVSVGLSTVTGYGVTVIGFATAVVAYLTGDHSQQTVGAITAGGIAALAFAITQIGRYVQAKAAIYAQPVPPFPNPIVVSDGSTGTASSSAGYIDFDGDGVFTPAPQSNAGPVSEGPGDPPPGDLKGLGIVGNPPADVGEAPHV